jgi:small-conductance mechanosensitive channel
MIPEFTALTPLQATIPDAIEETIAEVIAYLPTILSALVILIVGFIVGRIVGGIVKRIVDRIGIGDYTRGTAVESVSDTDGSDGISRALGKLVAYYIYFVTIVAAANVLDIPQLSETLSELASYLPIIFGAVVVLIVGFVVGRVIGDIVADVVSGFHIGPRLRDTPLEQFGDEEGEFGRIVGLLVTYYIYLLTLLAVADIVQIEALSELLDTFASYLPALVGGLVVLLVGIWVAERVGDMVADSDDGAATRYAGLAVKVLIYYITVTIALAAIGFETFVLASMFTAFLVAFFGAAALALAIGAGVALGLGGQDYVERNIGDWMSSMRNAARSDGGSSTGTGHSGTRDTTGSDFDSDSDLGDSDTDDTDFGDSDRDNSGLDD